MEMPVEALVFFDTQQFEYCLHLVDVIREMKADSNSVLEFNRALTEQIAFESAVSYLVLHPQDDELTELTGLTYNYAHSILANKETLTDLRKPDYDKWVSQNDIPF